MEIHPVDASEGPVILVGFSSAWLHEATKFMPDRSVVFIEEPDVIRKRAVRTATAESAIVHSVVDCEYHRDGAADCFYLQHRELRPSAVIPTLEYGVQFAGRLAERYGVVGAGYGAARILRDKHLLRQVTAAAGIPNPRSVEVHGPDEVAAFMAEVAGPIVLKPANRQASMGTRILRDPADVAAAWAECTDLDEGVFVPNRPMPLSMLAERFMHGDEFSVEMMFSHGRPVFGAATRKFLFAGPRPVEQGHLHPADIDAALSRRLVDDTATVLRAVGMDSGFAHCEWMLEDGIPHLIECAGRMAGDGIVELVHLAWDYYIVSQFVTMMQGRPLTEAPPAAPTGFAAVWMSRARPGRVQQVTGVERAGAIVGVNTVIVPDPGEETHELRSSWDRPVMVTARGDTPATALGAAQQAVEAITVTIVPAGDGVPPG
jgi:biotin carboxylase